MARKFIWDHKDSLFDAADASPLAARAAGQPAALVLPGTRGADIINGSANADTIAGGEGGDTLNGGGGDDIIFGYGNEDRSSTVGRIDATLVADGLDRPIFALSAPGDPNRLFILEQNTGQIKILDLGSGTVLATPFLDIDGLAASNEQGLLGMAFSPDYATTGEYYVFTNRASDGDIEVWRYTRGANPDVSDTGRELIIRIDHSDAGNHNGGWMAFGPDNMLYIATGDGGGGGDTDNDAQNVNSLLGKILRLDVMNGADDFTTDADRNYAIPDDNPFVGITGADEVFALGLRNPWRISIDPTTGDFYIADVGQGEWEEVNHVTGSELNGANFGWHVMEGNHIYDDDTPGNPAPGDPSLTGPIYEYAHDSSPFGGFAVTGGYVIRGPDIGGQGLYLFADFVTGNIWTLRATDAGFEDLVRRNPQIVADNGAVDDIASFGVDGQGRIYTVGLDGEIHRLTFNVGAGDGHDIIDGGVGNDRVFGGVGNDMLTGGLGADDLRGGAGVDTALYLLSGVGVRVGLDGSVGALGDAQGDLLSGIENITGSAFADRLTGSGDVNALRGGGGNDTLIGGAGADELYGNGGIDTASYVFSTTSVTVNLTTGDGVGGDAQGDILRQIENITGGAADDALTGNGVANTLEGRNGGDTLSGGRGNDLLDGGSGNDILNGGAEHDVLIGGVGVDTLTGGGGADAFVFNAGPLARHADTITDFGVGDDIMHLAQSVFTGLAVGNLTTDAFFVGAAANDAEDRIIYDAGTGALYFDVDGVNGQAQVRFATLTGAPTLTAADFLVI